MSTSEVDEQDPAPSSIKQLTAGKSPSAVLRIAIELEENLGLFGKSAAWSMPRSRTRDSDRRRAPGGSPSYRPPALGAAFPFLCKFSGTFRLPFTV
jgi:hypothetical protein